MLNELLQNDIILLTTILVIGIFIGKLKINSVAMSSSGGVLLAALLFGHFGFKLPPGLSTFGFAFFIYAVGFSAGPRFFQSFRANGLKFVLIAVFVVIIACGVAISMSMLFHLPLIMLPGILGGALTSTATLAAAYEIVQDPSIPVAYGVTYPFGLLGLLLFIQFFTRGLDIDLRSEAEQAKPTDDEGEDEDVVLQKRVYQVLNPGVVERTLKELNLRDLAGAIIVRIKRDHSIFRANAESKLHLNDHVLAEGPLGNLLELEEYLGREIVDNDLVEREKTAATVIVTNKKAVGKSVKELQLPSKYGVIFTHFRRGPVEMTITPDVVLERGDVLTLTGDKAQLKKAISKLGRGEEKKHETDIFMFCLGLLAGVVVGTVKLPLINTSIGMAAGLLMSGIFVGYFRHYGYYSGRMPRAARYILQELGMLFFLATVGVQAGQGLAEQLAKSGVALFVTGASVTLITLVCTLFFCRFVMKFDWNTSFGATTGGVTSTVALKMITDKAESQYALLGYAGVYAISNILLTLIGQVLVVVAL